MASEVFARYDWSELDKLLAELEARGGSIQVVSEQVAEELVRAVEENFRLERGHDQGAWEDLAQSTKDARRASASIQMLQDTGVLVGSITPHHDGTVAEAFTNVPYAVYHVSPDPRTVIPLRDFLDVDFEAIQEFAADLILSEMAA